jgi:hypothetical protein
MLTGSRHRASNTVSGIFDDRVSSLYVVYFEYVIIEMHRSAKELNLQVFYDQPAHDVRAVRSAARYGVETGRWAARRKVSKSNSSHSVRSPAAAAAAARRHYLNSSIDATVHWCRC